MHRPPFQESFWSPSASAEPIPNFSHGLNVLHHKLNQSVEENSAILDYLRLRVAVETEYARQLDKLTQLTGPQGTAFDRDVGAGLKKCFEVMRSESTESVDIHRRKANHLITGALEPLECFAARYENIIAQTKALMDQDIAQFEQAAHAVEEAKSVYTAKCQALEAACPGFKHPDEPVWLNSWILTRALVTELLDYLGNCDQTTVSGQDILRRTIQFWDNKTGSRATLPDTDQGWMQFCSALVSQGFVQSLACRTFSATPDAKYTIRSDINASSDTHPMSVDTEAGGLGNLFRWGRATQSKTQRSQAYQEMVEADQVYRKSVQIAEERRMQVEEALFVHYEEMASLELERIQTIKQAFSNVSTTMSDAIPSFKEMYERMMLSQEALKPDRDVQFIVEQYQTGRFCPRPIIYSNHFYSAAMHQTFGVSLEEYSRIHKALVPPLISQGLDAIEAGFTKIYKEEQIKAWTVGLQLEQAHEIRNQINTCLSADQIASVLNGQDILLLTSLIRLYFMELPECLLTFELYDPLKLCYTNQYMDESSRFKSISNLLISLPSANYHTLIAILSHFHRLVSLLEDGPDAEALIQNLAHTWSHILTRPATESTLNLHDKHPHRLARDLIKHFPLLFSESAQTAQKQHANKRVIVAHPDMLVTHQDTAAKKISLEAPSFASSTLSTTSSMDITTPTQPTFDVNPTEQERHSSESGPTSTRRHLLSFMKRNSSTPVSPVERPKSTHLPLLMPSSTTLFEDPDESVIVPPSPTVTRHPTDVATATSGKIMTDLTNHGTSEANST